jgi:NAD-dependent dihydropyrimidine dehydrogenase PreA subunit
MIRKIIQIDEEKCNGCGACAAACHEGAIGMVDGKAKLLRDDYCDGLGDCLPACPVNAITFTQREAAAYDAAAVEVNKAAKAACACPGSRAQAIRPRQAEAAAAEGAASCLSQWPVQLKLTPVQAPCFQGAHLLVAADCCAYAYGDFHRKFIQGRTTLIGCPKLDGVNYAEKLTEILRSNDIKSVTVVRMEVPCCGGIQLAVQTALEHCGKNLPCQVVVLSTGGEIISGRV